MKTKTVVCIGAALVDETFSCISEPLNGTSNPATVNRSAGGVARNVANHLSLLGHPVELISHFGFDADGDWLREYCTSAGIGISNSIQTNVPTGKFVALLAPGGELFTAAAVSNLETEVTPGFLTQKITLLKSTSVVLMDCNLSSDTLKWIIEFCGNEKIPCIIEPVSVQKSIRLKNINLEDVLLITPNMDELSALAGNSSGTKEQELVQHLLQKGIQSVWVKNGKEGSRLYSGSSMHELSSQQIKITDTTGAGDSALAGWMHGWLLKKNPMECLRYGQAMATIILQIKGATDKNLNAEKLENTLDKYKTKNELS